MGRSLLAVGATALFLVSAVKGQFDPVALTQSTAVRGEVVGINIPNGPVTGSPARASLSRAGVTFPAEAVYTASHADLTVPADLPYGDYLVTVSFPAPGALRKFVPAKRLSVVPDGKPEIRLSEFDPPATYQREAVYVPDTSRPSAKELDVENVDINDPSIASTATDIAINGERVVPVWNGCRTLPFNGDPKNPVPWQVFGAVTTNGLRLCRVPLNSNIRLNGNTVSVLPVPGSQSKLTVAVYPKGRRMYTTSLTLRGSGFLPSQPQDTAIWINGARIEPVWDSCETLPGQGRADSPVQNHIHGQIISQNEALLCRVPVPANNRLLVSAGYGDTHSETRMFQVYHWGERVIGSLAALVAFVLGLSVLLLLLTVKKIRIASDEYRVGLFFLDPETNTYSLSKCQFYLWTLAALFGYAYLYLSKVFVQEQPWPDIPGTLPGLIAIGAGTAIGSQLVTSMKGSKGAGDEKPNLSDFVTSGGVVAPDRVQMFVWTLFGVAAFCVAVLQKGPGTINELSPVPEGMLYLMGLSSAGYLGGKLARKPGPVISEVSLNPPGPDSGLAKARLQAMDSSPDFLDAIAAANMVLGTVSDPAAARAIGVSALREAVSAAGAAHTQTDLSALLVRLEDLRKSAEDAAHEAARQFADGKLEGSQAQTAQTAAAALQDFTASITQALSQAAVPVIAEVEMNSSVKRVIEVRGSNLSAEGTFEIDRMELPFRMLRNSEGKNAPDVLTHEDASAMARILRLTIDPGTLASTDLEQYKRWFSDDGQHLFRITNPDGQRAELSFAVPPGAAQKSQQGTENL